MQRFRRRYKIVAGLAATGVAAAVVVVRWSNDSSALRPTDSRERQSRSTGRTRAEPNARW